MGLRRFLRSLRRSQDEREVDEELRLHLELEVEELIRSGVPREEARRRVRILFGPMERIRAETRDVRRLPHFEALARDAGYTARCLAKRPAFSLVVIAVVAVGTAGTLAIFTLLNSIVLRPLPLPDADRLVAIRHISSASPGDGDGVSTGLFFHYQEHATSFDALGLYTERIQTLRLPDAATQRVNVTNAGVGFFNALGATPLIGRLFTERDGRQGFMNTAWPIPVLLSHHFWQTQFGSDPSVVGKFLTINDRPREVVGVLTENFVFPAHRTQIWMLWEPSRASPTFARNLGYSAVARLRRDVTPASAESELATLLPRIVGAYEDATFERLTELRLRPRVIPLKDWVIGDIARLLWTILGAMALLLVIGAANAASLFLIRADDRSGEMALRAALGASTADLKRLLILEGLTLNAVAIAVALALSHVLVRATVLTGAIELPRRSEIRLDGGPIVLAVVLALLMTVLYSLLSLRSQRQSLRPLVDEGTRSTDQSGIPREPLIALQVALALTLMTGSALMLKTYANLSRVELGFTPERLAVVEVSLPSSRARQHGRIFGELIRLVGQESGVERATAASFAPLTESEHMFPIERGGSPVPFKFFTPGYFETLKSNVVEGDSLGGEKRTAGRYPVLVSTSLAHRLFPNASAIGKALQRLNTDGTVLELGSGPVPPFTIVGVVEPVRETGLRGPTDIVYVPVTEPPIEQSVVPLHMTIFVRTELSARVVLDRVRRAAESVEPALSVGNCTLMDSVVAAATARERFVGTLLLLASVVSLFLGVVGIYGSVAHRVGRRTREIGIRVALGAPRMGVVWMVVSASMLTVALGAVLGGLMAFVAGQALTSLLFGVEPAEPWILVAVLSVLLLAACAAALLAGSRAARIEPAITLRAE